ncbi:MAG: tyrosine-type recombinase/integrase [Pirellulaceae bacterium]|nr:tyrosine-type recombinase/integrase [Pirellulaceae bacterium]
MSKDTRELTQSSASILRKGKWPIPAIIERQGAKAARRYFEFFTVNIRNRNTREAYHRALNDFFAWLGDRNVSLIEIEPVIVAAYVEYLGTIYSKPTVKQHLAAIRMCMDWLVVGQIIPMNPASSVRGPAYSIKRGKTPVLTADEARLLLDSIDIATLVGLRDRAIIATMLFTFARVSAVVGMKVDDYYQIGKRSWIRLHEKGGKHHEVPAHHTAEQYLDAYLQASGHGFDKNYPLFLSAIGRTNRLRLAPLSRHDAFRMIKRRAITAGLSDKISCHTFRATGITAYLDNGGTIENAQAIAAHESPRTTKLYDRTSDEITLDEIERIRI